MANARFGQRSKELAEKWPRLSPTERINSILANRVPEDQRFLSKFLEQQCHLKDIKTTSSTSTLVTFSFKVDIYYANPSGNLHGGAQSAIYDVLTSIALQALSSDGSPWSNGGVSRTLNVSYLRPAPVGEDLVLESEIVHTGKKLALLRGAIKRAGDGAVISVCDHDKAAVPMKPGWKL